MDFEALKQQWIEVLKDQDWDRCNPGNTYRPEPPPGNEDISDLPTLALQAPKEHASSTECFQTTIPVAGPGSNADIISGPAQYQFLDILGRGGMGEVYKAIQLNLAREVAIKKIRPEKITPGLLAAFHIEARVTARLDHPNIVPIYDLGQDEDGAALLVMKVVRGESWKRLLSPLSDEQKALAKDYDLEKHLGVLISVCHGLAFAHSRGILHCDLKPENIMVGAFGEVLIMDWGVAVDISDPADFPENQAPSNHKSNIRAARGTPVYMPPELIMGKGKDLDQRTDVYLLGAMLFEILEGSAPHAHDSLGEVLMKALKSSLVFQSDAPDELKSICKKAMGRKRRDRYASVVEFQEAITDFLEHRQSLQISEAAQGALDRSGSHDSSGIHSIYGDLSEAVAGFKQARLLWSGNPEAIEGERRARLQFARVAIETGDFALAQTQLSSLETSDPESLRLIEEIEKGELRRRQAENSNRGLTLLHKAQELIYRRRRQSEVIEWVEEALQVSERSEAALLAAAKIYDELDRSEDARAILEECVENHGPCYEALFFLHRLEVAHDSPGAFRFTPALQRLIEDAKKREEENEFTLFSKAIHAMENGDHDLALETYNLIEREHTSEFPWVYNGRGYIHFKQGRFDDALADYTRALDLEPSFAQAMHNRAFTRSAKGDFEGALEDFEETLSLEGESASLLNNRGGVYLSIGQEEKALRDFERSLELSEDLPGAWFNRGFLRLCGGQREDAMSDFREAARRQWGYAVPFLWLIALGQELQLEPVLRESWDSWWQTLASALLSEKDWDSVFEAISEDEETAREQRCEAYGYQGISAEFAGELERAKRCYEQCLEQGIEHFIESIWARKRLKQFSNQ